MTDLTSTSSRLKVIFFVHFLFSTFGIQGSWSPTSYLFYNTFFFLSILWALHSKDNEDPVQLAFCINGLSIIFDIIVLSIYYPGFGGANKFSAAMAVINLLIRPVSCVGLYRTLQERSGLDGPSFPANLGNIFGAPTSQHSPYEDIDHPHTMPQQSTPDTPQYDNKQSYNIVG